MTDCLCDVNYVGWTARAWPRGKPFDSSYWRSEQFQSTPSGVIRGWMEALLMMREGDKWELYIPADLAYEDRGNDPGILPGDALIFQVELLKLHEWEMKGKPHTLCDVRTLEFCTKDEKKYVK